MFRNIERAGLTALALAFMAGLACAQIPVCPPSPAGFDGLTGDAQLGQTNNGAQLEFITSSDSTDVVNNDNTAQAYLGEPIAVQFIDPRVASGTPMSICYSVGLVPFPIITPIVDGDIWLDINNPANFFTLLDGLALTQPLPNILGVTPGPNNITNLNVGVIADPGALNFCVTFQTILLDPLAPSPANVSFSNPVLFGIAATIRNTSPQIVTPGSSTTLTVPGQPTGGFIVNFPQGTSQVASATNQVTVPLDALSGVLNPTINVFNGISSPDGIDDYLVVTDATPSLGPPGAITLNVDLNLPTPGTSRATALGNLASATANDIWTVNLAAGDIIDIELYSVDFTSTRILDGFGNFLNPFSLEGFDPVVTLQQASNFDALVWEDAVALPGLSGGPFNLILDSSSGPENNARLRWQAKWTDTYNIVVTNGNLAGFASGNYLLNLVVTPGHPSVRRFNSSGLAVSDGNRVNVVPQAGTIDLVCDNLVVGNTYQVDFIPKAGFPFTTRLVTGVPAATNSLLSVTVPPFGPTDLPMGLHQIRLTDEVTGLQGLVWDNSFFTPANGVLPDLLTISGATITLANTITAPGLFYQLTAVNTETICLLPSSSNPGSNSLGLFNAPAAAGATVVYAEALGTTEFSTLLFDTSFTDFNNGAAVGAINTAGIYNPYLQTYAYGLGNPGPFNDNDGTIPQSLFPTAMGIGNNAAIIDTVSPLLNPGGGGYDFYVDQLVTTSPLTINPIPFQGVMLNIVIQ